MMVYLIHLEVGIGTTTHACDREKETSRRRSQEVFGGLVEMREGDRKRERVGSRFLDYILPANLERYPGPRGSSYAAKHVQQMQKSAHIGTQPVTAVTLSRCM